MADKKLLELWDKMLEKASPDQLMELADKMAESFNAPGREQGNSPELESVDHENYDQRFKEKDREILEGQGIPPGTANQYPSEFNGYGIKTLVAAGYSPEKTHEFLQKHNKFIVWNLAHLNVSPDEVEKFYPRFSSTEIAYLAQKKITADHANSFPKRFVAAEIGSLLEKNITAEEAGQFHARFKDNDILRFSKEGFSAEEANPYASRFDGYQTFFLLKYSVPFEDADKYSYIMNEEEIALMHALDIKPEDASRLELEVKRDFFFPRDYDFKITPDQLKDYNNRFTKKDILFLVYSECPPKKANSFAERFDGRDIKILHEHEVDPEETEQYDQRFNAIEIALLKNIGIKPENLPKEKQQKLFALLKDVINADITKKAGLKLLGVGTSAVVLFNPEAKKVWKLSQDIQSEFELLDKIHRINEGKQLNVVKLRDTPKENLALEIEYIQGQSLEQILRENERLPQNKILRYCADTCNGILEARKAGIYHRDLHDKNVLIDENLDRAVIIDFGHSTEDPADIYSLNRAYGGNNDLISLGQLMYRMVTGHNLFKEGIGYTQDSEAKEGIKRNREKTYANPEQKSAMLRKIREDLEGQEKLSEIIIKLLDDDLWTQPSLERVYEIQKNIYEKITT